MFVMLEFEPRIYGQRANLTWCQIRDQVPGTNTSLSCKSIFSFGITASPKCQVANTIQNTWCTVRAM